MFQKGDKVKTTDYYFGLFGRTVYGIVQQVGEEDVTILCTGQSGNIIPSYGGELLIMNADDLQLDMSIQ